MWLISTTARDGRPTIKGQDRRQVVHAWTGATAAVQDRDTDGLNKTCHARDVKKWLALGYILAVKQTGLANVLHMGNEENREMEDDT